MRTAQNYHADTSLAILLESTAYRVVIILFDDHYQHQAGQIAHWFAAFQRNVLEVLSKIGFSEDQAVYILRSRKFCEYVQQLIKAI